MHHPWRRFREILPDWDLTSAELPHGILGTTDTHHQRIFLDSRMLQAQRRCTLDHELHHAEAGDVGCQHPKREAAIDQASARRLLPIDVLLHVLPWASSVAEAADECWVDQATLRVRLEHLHPSERAAIRRAFHARDNTDE